MKQQNIQVLRILACFGVFVVHLGQRLEFCDSIKFFTDYGAMGVYLFFLVSGYVTFLSFEKTGGMVKVLHYYIIRFARILPVYYAVILCQLMYHTYILGDVPVDGTHLGWSRYIFCISRVIPANDVFWTNLNSTWTIGAFLLFYLIAPFLHRWIRNYNTALNGWIVSYLISFVLNRCLPGYFEPVVQMQYFLFGIVVYYIEKEKKISQGVSFYLISLFMIIFLAFERQNGIWTLFFGLLVMGSRNLSVSNGFLRRCVNTIDEYSYSIYLIHVTVMDYVDRWKLSHTENWRVQAFAIIICGSAVGVFLAHNLIEKPVYSFIKKHADYYMQDVDRNVNKGRLLVKPVQRLINLVHIFF